MSLPIERRYKLLKSDRYSDIPSDEGVEESRFWVHLLDLDEAEGVFSLDVMSSDEYARWSLDRLYGEFTIPFPLIIPNEQLGSKNLTEYVEDTYLNLDRPYDVNAISQFLIPLEIDREVKFD